MTKFILTRQNINLDKTFTKLNFSNFNFYFVGNLIDLRNKEGEGLVFLGDCINPRNTERDILYKVGGEPKGNYYLFHITDHKIALKSSGFGILPVFYCLQEGVVASNVKLITDLFHLDYTFNKKWLVNQLLFNYQFNDFTVYEEIRMLSAFAVLEYNDKSIGLVRTSRIYDFFVQTPLKWKEQLKPLSQKFIEICNQYFPNENFYISFTGGFDGRTIVSVAKHLKKTFKTFSYGRRDNDDVFIPKRNSEKLGIEYKWIALDQEYVNKHYLSCAINFLEQTSGGNGFLYAHVNYSANQIGQQTNTLISGIGGSELFRAMHIAGAVFSPALVQLFKSKTVDDYRAFIQKSPAFKYLRIEEYESAIEEVAFDCWKYRTSLPEHLTLNQQMYVFVFEEVFRKFFGNWLLAQSNDVIVRTPFLDIDFVIDLLKTELAGVYSDFMTENPLKRYKGQVFYSEVIRRSSHKIFWQETGKGYPPALVRYASLRPLLVIPFVSKRLIRNFKKENLDNLAIISGVMHNCYDLKIHEIETFKFEELLYDVKALNPYTDEIRRDNILMLISIYQYLASLKSKYKTNAL